jgi:hypothetical protein
MLESLMRMLQQFDAGKTNNLTEALELPPDESANEAIEIIADRWLSSLLELEQRAQAIIRQIGLMIEMLHTQ